MRMTVSTLVLFSLLTAGGCTCTQNCGEGCDTDGDPEAGRWPAPLDASQSLDESVMSRLNSLEGEWEMQGEDGVWTTSSIFAVSSSGSVVREIMFPGEPHEMTNLYHMDGTEAVATHYCAIGNQPRMTAAGVEQTEGGPAIDYTFDSVSNLRESQSHVMGGLRLVFVDENTLHQHWTSLNNEGEFDHEMTFELRRKR